MSNEDNLSVNMTHQAIQNFQLCPKMTKISCILVLFMVNNYTKCKHLVQNNIKKLYYIILYYIIKKYILYYIKKCF